MKKILVVVDCQNDFISGALRNEEAIKKIPNIVKKIRGFKGDAIYVTRDSHQANYMDTKEGQKLPVAHCIYGTDGWRIEDNIQAALNDAKLRNIRTTYIDKPTFGSDLLAIALDNLSREGAEIEFIGFCTDICVISNVLLAKAKVYETAEITVDASCCAGVTVESHNAALATMKMCQINVINE